jgi:2-methylcitrate dehydratase PrpD
MRQKRGAHPNIKGIEGGNMLQRIATLLDGIKYAALPVSTVEKTKTAILNFFGGSLPGSDKDLTLAEKDFWTTQGQSGNCVILGFSTTVSCLTAAAVNAAMGEIFLSEDVHMPTSSHPGMIVIPVAMAVGQHSNTSGRQIVESIVAGYETMGRIGAALIGADFAKNGMRPASVLAPFGGAVAAAKAMGLDAEAIARAISIAGNTATGIMEFVNAGTADICIQNSFAAKNAVISAFLAAAGIQGSPTILDGRFGLGLALTDAECNWNNMFNDSENKNFMIDATSVKAFPGCAYVQATAQAAMNLIRQKNLTAGEIKRITVGVCHASKVWPGVDFQGPFKGTISAMMSHQFMVASAIIHGEINAKTVCDYKNADVAAVTKKISVEVDEEIEKMAPDKSGCRLTVELTNGEIFSRVEKDVIPLDREGVIERLRQNGKQYFQNNRINEIVNKTLAIETLSSIQSLMDLLKPDLIKQ